MRKSPIRHRVHAHKRLGRPVKEYFRGKGQKKISRNPWRPSLQSYATKRKKLIVKPKLRMYPKDKHSVQAYLEKGTGFADVSIVPHVNKINRVGFETIASCSGLRKDHYGVDAGAYLSIELPRSVVTPDILKDEVDPKNIKDKAYVNTLINTGHKAGWNAHLGKYMLIAPVIRFSLPRTRSWKMDLVAKAHPELIKANRDIDLVQSRPGHTTKEFLDAVDKRNKIQEDIYKRYGGRKRTDTEKLRLWDKLVKELSKVKPK